MAFVKLSLLFILATYTYAQKTFNQRCFDVQGVEYTKLYLHAPSQKLLVVNTQTLETRLLHMDKQPKLSSCSSLSNYHKLRVEVLAQPKRIANRGMKVGKQKAFALTVDMCPSSKKGFELDFFKSLINQQASYPVTISLTQKWAQYHPKEFEQLKRWDDSKALTVTWMSHGSHHPYERGIAIENNFINLDGFDFKKEVLDNQNFLIQQGRTPSIFYRFAGLVSNEKAFNYLVSDLGLIPVGSLAWLAKGEKLTEQSIVLVHGNKNEPLGIQRFLELKTAIPVIKLPQLFIQD